MSVYAVCKSRIGAVDNLKKIMTSIHSYQIDINMAIVYTCTKLISAK